MTLKQQLLAFMNRESDRVPFMPIFMRYCAGFAGLRYRDFVLDPRAHCAANTALAGRVGSCWVNTMSDPYCELDAYGAEIEYVENDLPLNEVILCPEIGDLERLPEPRLPDNRRTAGRLEQIREYRRTCAGEYLITGWVEGPVAEYCDLRGIGNAFLDFYDFPDRMHAALENITATAERFIDAQLDAGADCIGIGDAACSQIGAELYRDFAWPGEKRLVDRIHARGALAKLHICGNTTAIIPLMIATGADIIDIDHGVRDMSPFVRLLAPHQFFCGNLDPVTVLQNGSRTDIAAAVRTVLAQAPGRLILSGGCEITPDTPLENLTVFHEPA